jgi:hypothetical protein
MVFIMALDPNEVVTLTNHGTMPLHLAVERAMMLPAGQRGNASILRGSEPSRLDFQLIRHLATRWDGTPRALDDAEMATGAFFLKQAGMMIAFPTEDQSVTSSDIGVTDISDSESPRPIVGPHNVGVPRFRQFSTWQTAGDVFCCSP